MVLIIQHIEKEGPGTIKEFFEANKREVKIVKTENPGLLPETLENTSAMIILGGPMNVYQTDKYPFLIKEEELIREAIEKKIPTLGICLGAQLIAKTLGSEVISAKEEQIGWYKLNPTPGLSNDALLKGYNSSFVSFQWHNDTFELPKGAALLVTESECKNQAFRIGKSVWGLQFHPEMSRKMINDWLNGYQEEEKMKILNNYDKVKDKYEKQAQALYLNFTGIIDRRHSI